MNKKLLSMAVAAAMAAPFAVQAENTVYGKVHMSVDYVDATLSDNVLDVPDFLDPWPLLGAHGIMFPGTGIFGGGTDNYFRGSGTEADQSLWQVESRASRLGVKGSEDLGNGLKAIYKMEFEIDVDGEIQGIQASRNMYGGLSHAQFGTVLAGRHDTPYKVVFGSWDRFSDRLPDDDRVFGDYKGGIRGNTPVNYRQAFGGGASRFAGGNIAGFDDIRASNVLAYISPEFAGVTFSAASVAAEDDENDSLNSNGWSLGALGSWGPIKGALAYEEISLDQYTGIYSDRFLDDDTKWGAAIAWDQAPFYVGLRYEDRSNAGNVKDFDVQQYQIAAEFTFGNNVLKAMYQDLSSDQPGYSYIDWDADAWAVGIDHKFSKRTKLYALYMQSSQDIDTPFGLPLPATSAYTGGSGATPLLPPVGPHSLLGTWRQTELSGAPRDVDAFSIGMEHKF
ncbi:MAG: porin [Chromatiales bacterium]